MHGTHTGTMAVCSEMAKLVGGCKSVLSGYEVVCTSVSETVEWYATPRVLSGM